MWNEQEKQQFLEHGYLHVRGLLDQPRVETIRAEFEDIWGRHGRSNQHVLLQYPTFIDLIEHPPILERVGAVFGRQTQLLQYDFLRQERNDTFPLRGWHRDFSFAGDRPLSMNVIVYLDEMTDERGPTYVVPGSQRGDALPPKDMRDKPMPGEVAVYADPGDAVFINSAIWHSGSRNQAQGLRRAIYMYYGYWWLKRYESDRALPPACLRDAGEMRLRLLGFQMPDGDVHMYDPTKLLRDPAGK